VTFPPSVVLKRLSSVIELEIQARKEDIKEYLSGRMSDLCSVVQDNKQFKIKAHILPQVVDGMYVQLCPFSLTY
jgi:hypothetical protein